MADKQASKAQRKFPHRNKGFSEEMAQGKSVHGMQGHNFTEVNQKMAHEVERSANGEQYSR